MRFSALAALIIALPAASSARAQLTTAEQAMIRTVDVEQGRTVSMLTRWVEQNSGTLNLPGVAAVGKMVGAELQPLGMELQWIDMKAAHRSGHLVAAPQGQRRRQAPAARQVIWTLSSRQTRCSGTGGAKAIGPMVLALPMKGGDAVIVPRCARCSKRHAQDADIPLLTGDEEDAASQTRSRGAT